MMAGLSGFMVSMTLCGLVVSAGLRHLAAPLVIFILFLLARALFGLFGSASNPATQAYVADHTPREQRTQSMAMLAGAFGIGTVVGPFLAPIFIYPVVGLAGPLFTFALIAAVMLVMVWRFLPDLAALHVEDAFKGQRGADPFEWPMLARGFPAKAVDHGGEPARLLVECEVSDAHQRVLRRRRDNIEVGGIFC